LFAALDMATGKVVGRPSGATVTRNSYASSRRSTPQRRGNFAAFTDWPNGDCAVGNLRATLLRHFVCVLMGEESCGSIGRSGLLSAPYSSPCSGPRDPPAQGDLRSGQAPPIR
jgi:hypothetical protein